jgi:hypothetical protein
MRCSESGHRVQVSFLLLAGWIAELGSLGQSKGRGFTDQLIEKPIMNNATKRSILRWIHLIFSIPIIGYVYSPFAEIPNYAAPTRFVFLPMLVASGLWMWKGDALRRLVSKRPA